MGQQNLKDTAMEIVREAIRKGDVLESGEILQTVPELVGCVKVSQVRLGKMLERSLEDGNPLNSLLGLLGFRLVNTRKLNGGSTLEATGQSLDRVLTIDRPRLEAAVEKLAGLLTDQEKRQGEENGALRQKYNGISRDLDAARRETERLTQEQDAAKRAVADRVQYLLSLTGPQNTASPMAEQLMELLSDVELEAVWPEEKADASLFTVIKAEDPENHKVKPCIRSGGQVVAKGVCFVRPEGDDTPET